MRGRLISWRGAAGIVLGVAVCGSGVACGGGARREAPAEDPGPLVIPPLGPDARKPDAAVRPDEPVEVRTALTLRARDPRIEQRQPRSRTLVLTEIQRLEVQLGKRTDGGRSDPTLRRRLAEAYSELARTASGPDAERARDKSIESYVALEAEHPEYALIDEVLYYLGLAYELNGDHASARRSYLELIANHPRSRLVPLAYFGFGELYFAEATRDPSRNVLALQAYDEVLKHRPTDPAIAPDALLRIGVIHRRMNDDAMAKQTFERLRRDFPNSDAAARIPLD